MLISIASAKGSPGASTSAHVLAAVWPRPVVLAELDPVGSDLVYRTRSREGAPLDSDRGVVSLAAAIRPPRCGTTSPSSRGTCRFSSACPARTRPRPSGRAGRD